MLTFEKVLDAFKDYLSEDTRYEIVTTSRGYTILEWDSRANTWAGEELCATPEIMRDVLLDDFTGYMEYKALITNGKIDEIEQAKIEKQRKIFLEQLQ